MSVVCKVYIVVFSFLCVFLVFYLLYMGREYEILIDCEGSLDGLKLIVVNFLKGIIDLFFIYTLRFDNYCKLSLLFLGVGGVIFLEIGV